MSRPRLLTLTLNPAIDLNLNVSGLKPSGDMLRASAAARAAGGKGVNVSRVLTELDLTSTAACLLGGPDASVYLSLLQKAAFEVVAIAAGDFTRTNVTLTPERGRALKINQSGPRLSRAQWAGVMSKLKELFPGRSWVVLSGTLPPGVPAGAYRTLADQARHAGAAVALDAEGEPLRLALKSKPALVKLNRAELARTLGVEVHTARQQRQGLERLHALGARWAVLTHGRGELLASDGHQLWSARPPAVEEQSPMGAGDSTMAGLVASLERGQSLPDALALGIACGAACASAPDTVLALRPAIKRFAKQVHVQALG